MKATRDLPAELAERLDLPEELLPGKGRLTLDGGRQELTLSGDGLRVRAMNAGELFITGRIRAVEWG